MYTLKKLVRDISLGLMSLFLSTTLASASGYRLEPHNSKVCTISNLRVSNDQRTIMGWLNCDNRFGYEVYTVSIFNNTQVTRRLESSDGPSHRQVTWFVTPNIIQYSYLKIEEHRPSG